MLLASIFLVISLVTFNPENHPIFTKSETTTAVSTGIIGTYLAQYLVFALGMSAYSIPFLLFFWSCSFFVQRVPEKKFLKLVGFFIFMFAASGFMALLGEGEGRFNNGGYVGFYFAKIFETYFGTVGGFCISGFLLFLSFILATEFLMFPLLKLLALAAWTLFAFIGRKIKGSFEAIGEIDWHLPKFTERKLKPEKVKPKEKSELVSILRKANLSAEKNKVRAQKELEEEEKTGSLFRQPPPELKIKKYASSQAPQTNEEAHKEHERRKEMLQNFLKKKADKKGEIKAPREETVKEISETKPKVKKTDIKSSKPDNAPEANEAKPLEEEKKEAPVPPKKPYTTPPINLFEKPKQSGPSDDDMVENSKLLERTLQDFGVEAKVVEVEQGPVITRYEVLPAPGIKVNRITCLSDDLALAMKSPSIRFIAPIPGKSAVGIEVPNTKQATVTMRELLELDYYQEAKKKYRLPLMLGKKANGAPLIADLADMPHLLVAGTTGSGKTVCMNAIITGLIYTHSPENLRFVMIDPKMVEMANYNVLPHMLMPVVTDSKKSAATLQGVVLEMENRYNLLAAVGVRNISAFNEREPIEGEMLGDKLIPKKMPYIIVVIDELADLMLVARDKVETTIQRLAQLSRAVGIHLVLATQKPSVDVITGVIKANLPARIAFQVTSKVDSRVILDTGGADKLIGKGDMLFQPPGAPKPKRAQCTFITDKEIKEVIDHLKGCEIPDYETNLTETQKAGGAAFSGMEKDELYDEAVKVVIEMQQASVSTLQRRLALGYSRAARIMDMMQEEGIVGPPRGAKPREILIGREQETAEY